MAMFNKIFLILLIGIILIFAASNLAPHPVPTVEDEDYLTFGSSTSKLIVEIADDEIERARGLSGRAALEPDRGLLFIFDAPGSYGFWMKEMNFPIDIIWLDEAWRVADISKNVSPDSYPQVFSPSRPIKYVLEVNAGWSDQNNLSVGVKVRWNQSSSPCPWSE